MNKLFLTLGLGLLFFTFACGSSGGGNNNSFGGGGNTSNSKLSGQYAYELTGIDLNTGGNFFREAGVFTADGNGNITSGVDDFAEGTSVSLDVATSGSYSISSDGTGSAVLNFANSGSMSLAFTVVSASQVDLIEVDGLATAGGTAWLQTTSAFAASPTGTFAFRLHTFGTTADSSVGAVGAFTVAGGALTGNEDVERAGTLSSLGVTGSFNSPDTTSGRGTGSINDGVTTTTFTYYVIDGNTALLFSSLPGANGLGRMEKQTTTTFSTASLSGGYAFGSRGDTATVDGVRTVGRFAADGSGNVTGGSFDSVQDGTSSSDVSITGGTYTMSPSGRADVMLTASTGTIQEVYWMVSPSRAFFLVDDSTKVEDGTADLQQTGTFSNSSVNGTYVFLTDGFTFSTGDTFDRVGTLTSQGSGTMVLNYAVNVSGSASTVTLNGSYSVDANGRMTGSVNTLSSNLVFYLVSGSQAYILQNDSGAEIDGSMTQQQ